MSDEQLARLGQHVAAEEDGLPAAEPNEGTRRMLAEYAARRRGSAPPEPARTSFFQSPWLRLSLAALLITGVFALKEAVFWNPPLSFTVGADGETGVLRDWEEAPDDRRLPIRFSDGTRVELEPNARARVVAIGRAGAEIVIESGKAHIDVVPARYRVPGESPWRVSLGPFAVEVKGTRFDVGWDPRADDFALDLFEGSVSVKGCAAGQSHTLVAGQGVRASCSKGSFTVSSLTELAKNEVEKLPGPTEQELASEQASGGAPDAPELAPAAPDAGAARAAPRARRQLARSNTARAASWQQLARDGRYAAAYDAALHAGFERACEHASASDLVLLGDTARLQGDARRARQAYSAVRRRFAGSAAAGNAAFALGRLAVDADPGLASHWFELYLREQPTGPLAASADDWLFELAGQARDPSRRRDVAKTYLQRHPNGAHARDARRILDAASTP
jgi:hypothetical protein